MATITLISGGARSGKSSFAEELALKAGGRVLYVATAKAIDQEMEDRIRLHQQRRPDHWDTLESYRYLGEVLPAKSEQYDMMLIDCVTILCTNILFDLPYMMKEEIGVEEMAKAEEFLMREIDALIDAFPRFHCDCLLVTNEVGLGLVPDSPLSRFYRDALGRVNQKLADAAHDVWFTISGIPVKIKG